MLTAFLCLSMVAGVPHATQAAFHFSPREVLMDEVVRVRLTGLEKHARVTIRAVSHIFGFEGRSEATFDAGVKGEVDLASQSPTGGSYAGVDPMGIFWSMGLTPTNVAAPAAQRSVRDPVVTSFEADVDGKILARGRLTRRWVRPGLRSTDVRENGLVGRLYEPAGNGRHPAVIVFSGSEGGIKDEEAALLASHGFAAFALAYFREESLPAELVDIPLEYVKNGIDWLLARKSVRPDRLGVIGHSKGAELALLTGATFPEIRAVVANAPTSATAEGIDARGAAKGSSWSYQGKPLATMKPRATPGFTSQFGTGKPVRLLELHKTSLENPDSLDRATIPVENIRGPVLLISGTDDQMGPSSAHADRIIARLRANKHPYAFTHLRYDGAGHAIYSAYMPTTASTTAGRWALGGTAAANARAMAASRPQVLRFLRESLIR